MFFRGCVPLSLYRGCVFFWMEPWGGGGGASLYKLFHWRTFLFGTGRNICIWTNGRPAPSLPPWPQCRAVHLWIRHFISLWGLSLTYYIPQPPKTNWSTHRSKPNQVFTLKGIFEFVRTCQNVLTLHVKCWSSLRNMYRITHIYTHTELVAFCVWLIALECSRWTEQSVARQREREERKTELANDVQ